MKTIVPNKAANEIIHVTEIDDGKGQYVIACDLFEQFYKAHEAMIKSNSVSEPLITWRSIYIAGFMAGKMVNETLGEKNV